MSGLGPEPDRRCPVHVDNPAHYPCRACATAQTAWAEWSRLYQASKPPVTPAVDRILDETRARRAACTVCNTAGYLADGSICRHDPLAAQRTRTGVAACLDALPARTEHLT